MANKQKGAREPRVLEVAAADETAELRFGDKLNESAYKLMLEELQDSPKGSTLKISVKARHTALKHIREMGLRVQWAKSKDGQFLYIKVTGEADPPLTFKNLLPKSAPVAHSGDQLILQALQHGPLSLKELARELKVAPTSLAPALSRLSARGGPVENDDGIYRLRAVGARAI